MFVYVLMDSSEYTYDTLMGIFATEEEAREAKRQADAEWKYKTRTIHKFPVGSVVEFSGCSADDFSLVDLGDLEI